MRHSVVNVKLAEVDIPVLDSFFLEGATAIFH